MTPDLDYHALAPEIVLTVDDRRRAARRLLLRDRAGARPRGSRASACSRALIPVLTLAADGGDRVDVRRRATSSTTTRWCSRASSWSSAYVTLLLSFDYIGEGDYYQGEYYVLLLTSVLGMMRHGVGPRSHHDLRRAGDDLDPDVRARGMAQARHEVERGRAQVLPDRRALDRGDALRHVAHVRHERARRCSATSREYVGRRPRALFAVAIFLTLVGFAFKVERGAVPLLGARHLRRLADAGHGVPLGRVEGRRLRRACSRSSGSASSPSDDSWQPVLWVLAAASMILGNLAALRQTNIVRMLAYSSIAQGGFILVPLAVAGDGGAATSAWRPSSSTSSSTRAMNLGAFAVVIAVARRTRSAEISSFAGLGRTRPGLALMMSIFLFSLAGIPPLAGWFAKFVMFRAVFDAGHRPAAVVLGVDRRGQLRDRVLLLRGRRPPDVVPRAGDDLGEPAPQPTPFALERGDRPRRPASCSSSASTRSSSPASASSPSAGRDAHGPRRR